MARSTMPFSPPWKTFAQLNQMREEEGRGIERELRERMAHVQQAEEWRNIATLFCRPIPSD